MPTPDRFCIRRNDLFLSVHYDMRTRQVSIKAMPRPFARLFDSAEDAEDFRAEYGEPTDTVEIY